MLELNKIYHGDSLELDSQIDDKSIDMILEDMPYGTTACKWDKRIDLEKYWQSRKRIIKDNGAIVLTASQPFTSMLVMSNLKMFKYEWIWERDRVSGFLNSHKMPMKAHENIIVFYSQQPIYNPIKTNGNPNHNRGKAVGSKANGGTYGNFIVLENVDDKKYPRTVQYFPRPFPNKHETEKPVSLFEYLIRTYTNEGDIVLDGFAGSGTTGVACINTNRNFICIEKDAEYYEKAKKRIEDASRQIKLAI